MPSLRPTRARIARRVIDVLDFFDEDHPTAKLTDLVRRFDWPQSSTSELLMALVDLGLLHHDRKARTYSLTPRAALLGSEVQPNMVRDGRLVALVGRLSAQTGLGVGIFAMVESIVQVCCWCPGKLARPAGLRSGAEDLLPHSAVGLLLLSTMAQTVSDAMIRDLEAEVAPEPGFGAADWLARIEQYREQRHATGAVGFGASADVTAVLLPGLREDRPLAIGFVYEPSSLIDADILLHSLWDAVTRSIGEKNEAEAAGVERRFNIA